MSQSTTAVRYLQQIDSVLLGWNLKHLEISDRGGLKFREIRVSKFLDNWVCADEAAMPSQKWTRPQELAVNMASKSFHPRGPA